MRSVTSRDPRKVYFEKLVFMLALLIPAVFINGFRPLVIFAVSLVSSMLADHICCRVQKLPYDYTDPCVLYWAGAFSMLMPVGIHHGQLIIGSVICVVIGKHIFGGNSNIVFSPPAIAAAFLIICYPGEMLYYPRTGDIMPVFGEYSGAMVRSVENTIRLGSVPSQSVLDILLGNAPGAFGTVNILIIAVCGICLIIRRSTSICAVASCIATVSVLAFFYPRIDVNGGMSIFYELSCGYMLFGIFFLATEPHLLPKRRGARVIYGMVLGYTVMMFRYFGQVECCFVFALLITDALSGSFDTMIENLQYWKKTYLSSYERSKNDAQHGAIKLTDTQEIQIPEKYRYNTPPIDGEVKRHRRRKHKEHKGGGSGHGK